MWMEICAMTACVYVCVYVCVCVRKKVYPDLFWIKPPEGDKDTSGAQVWRLD